MTTLLHLPQELQNHCSELRAAGHRIGLVPTMGALHAGHLSLIEAVRRAGADRVVVTIFVNPLQFGAEEDLDRYPRTLQADLAQLKVHDPLIVFAPAPAAMYPSGFQTHVEVTQVTSELEGALRPHHFQGVTTVVAKLFNLAGPCIAAFGQKDYQQLCVIRRMVQDLLMPIQVLGCPIVREPDGLAMSSRNRYLSPEDRQRATALVQGLRRASAAFAAGERQVEALRQQALQSITAAVDQLDYVVLTDPDDLTVLSDSCGDRATLLVAAKVGQTRLIDNTVLGQDVLSAR